MNTIVPAIPLFFENDYHLAFTKVETISSSLSGALHFHQLL
nr:MAG TPA: hypothetical protein [Caudoviricetes sp.]